MRHALLVAVPLVSFATAIGWVIVVGRSAKTGRPVRDIRGSVLVAVGGALIAAG